MARGQIGDEGKEVGSSDSNWLHGFNVKAGLPLTLLVDKPFDGPWRQVALKNQLFVEHLDGRRAWRGSRNETVTANRLVERLNGWEQAREFRPGTEKHP